MIKEVASKRIIGPDIVRFLAILFVISVHFFLNNGFYSKEITSVGDFFLILFRELFFTCVPLFLILTGYLNGHQKFNKNYVYKILKILISYFLIAIICVLVKIFYMDLDISKTELIASFFDFSAAPYAWYVEMYIGLFFLIPFLNILYDYIKTKKGKKSLIGVLILLTALPPTLNSFMYNGLLIAILPDYWVAFYPVLYYFIGRYLKEYSLNISLLKKIFFLITILLVQSMFEFILSYNSVFNYNVFNSYGNIFTVIIASLIVEIFIDKDIKNKISKKIISFVALVSFEMYLISYVFDKIFYKNLVPVEHFYDNIINYFICAVPVFICSIFSAAIIYKISDFLSKKLRGVYDYLCIKLERVKE